MAKVSSAENALCGLVIFILVVGFLGSIVMAIILSVWQTPAAPAWTITRQGEVYYGVEVTYNDSSTVWQYALYQTTSTPFSTWTTLYCNQMAVILGANIGRQYGGCTVISFRPGQSPTASVIVQFRITLLATPTTSNVGCAAAMISNAMMNVPMMSPPLYTHTTVKIFNIPVPPSTSNTCQYTSSCRTSDVCQVSQSMPAGTPVCSNITMTAACTA